MLAINLVLVSHSVNAVSKMFAVREELQRCTSLTTATEMIGCTFCCYSKWGLSVDHLKLRFF